MSATLQSRAERAAADLIAKHDLAGTVPLAYNLLVPLVAMGWLEGWQAGGDEATEIVRATFHRSVRDGLHSVKS